MTLRPNLILRPDLRRLTVLGFAAIISSFVGCSMFKEVASPQLNAEVTPGPAPAAPPAAKFVVEIRPNEGKPQAVEKPLSDQLHIQTALEQTGALKKFDRSLIAVYRPLPSGGWHKMNLEFDNEHNHVPPEYDYAVLAGDRIIVTEDTTTFFDDAMQRALKPFGIKPAKKKDPLADRYEFRE